MRQILYAAFRGRSTTVRVVLAGNLGVGLDTKSTAHESPPMIENPNAGTISRRTLLSAAAALFASPAIAFGRDDSEDAEVARVRGRAKSAGLGEFRVSRNEQYLAIGNAPDDFRGEALKILSGLARDYLAHFTSRKFDVQRPAGRMTLVILADRSSFGAYLGTEPDGLVGGVYDPDANDLAFFDNRANGGPPGAEKDNTLVLIHEATHQLTFNTGLLNRKADIPLAIAEGLANYAEVRSPSGKPSRIGDVNARRLLGLRSRDPRTPLKLPPVESLIRDDDRLRADDTRQVGYSEAWLLAHSLMQIPKLQPKFKAYLKAMQQRADASHRIEDWREHLGEPASMDRDLASHLQKMWTSARKKGLV